MYAILYFKLTSTEMRIVDLYEYFRINLFNKSIAVAIIINESII